MTCFMACKMSWAICPQANLARVIKAIISGNIPPVKKFDPVNKNCEFEIQARDIVNSKSTLDNSDLQFTWTKLEECAGTVIFLSSN